MNIANHKKTILIIIVLLLAFFGYWFVFVSNKDTVSVGDSQSANLKTQVNISDTPYDKEFVSSLLGLNSVSLDVSIFESKTYKALSYPETPFVVNYSRESGRNNPFLPIGIDSGTLNSGISTQNKNNTNTSSTTVPAPTTLKNSTTTPASTPTPNPTPIPKKF